MRIPYLTRLLEIKEKQLEVEEETLLEIHAIRGMIFSYIMGAQFKRKK